MGDGKELFKFLICLNFSPFLFLFLTLIFPLQGIFPAFPSSSHRNYFHGPLQCLHFLFIISLLTHYFVQRFWSYADDVEHFFIKMHSLKTKGFKGRVSFLKKVLAMECSVCGPGLDGFSPSTLLSRNRNWRLRHYTVNQAKLNFQVHGFNMGQKPIKMLAPSAR